jgi:hypothetical protein
MASLMRRRWRPTLLEPAPTGDVQDPINYDYNDFEVFKKTTAGANFRTVGWLRASVIFLKGELPYLLMTGLV